MAKKDLKEYRIWKAMKSRCYAPCLKHLSYQQKGIIVCDEWKNSFDKFYEDMGPIPSNKHSLDRINNNGNYCKENCRWATAEQQANNKRNNIRIKINDKILSVKELSTLTNLSKRCLYKRIGLNKTNFNIVRHA